MGFAEIVIPRQYSLLNTMKETKMGRPKFAPGKARGKLVGARFNEEEELEIERKVKESGLVKSEWIRQKLLN